MKAIETKYKGYRFRSQEMPLVARKKISARADRTGHQYGRLTVVEDLGPTSAGYRWFGCACACGELVAVRSRELTRGHTQSCGCLQREMRNALGGQNTLPSGHASRNELLASYIKSAQSRGHTWGLTADYFTALVVGDCRYCGTPPDRERKPNKGVNGGFAYTGIDREDNTIGYEVGNVVSCCWTCNRAKGPMSAADFEAWIARVSTFRGAQA